MHLAVVTAPDVPHLLLHTCLYDWFLECLLTHFKLSYNLPLAYIPYTRFLLPLLDPCECSFKVGLNACYSNFQPFEKYVERH